MSGYRTDRVPVAGGDLLVGRWGPDGATPVVAVHGITANHRSFAAVAAALPEFLVVAPDLRGRGGSGALPGPWGMARHAEDVAAVIDSVGGSAIVVAHSMGGFVATAVARARPERVRGLVLLDGGLPLRLPPGMSVEQATVIGLGPALARLRMRFPTRSAYRDFWRIHPALSADWSPVIEAYVDYDLVGEAPELHSSVDVDAVAQDSVDQYDGPPLAELFGDYPGPARLLVVAKGLNGAAPPLYPDDQLSDARAALDHLQIEAVADLNHYTLVFDPTGVARVAAAVRSMS